MPQHYKRKTETEHPTEGRILAALEAIANGMTFRKAAEEFGILKSALQRYQAKQKGDASAPSATPLAPNYQHAQIFFAAQEQQLMQFIVEMSDMFHGYTYTQLRIFVYEMAVTNIRIPRYWQENKMASSCTVHVDQLKAILPLPVRCGTTSRTKGIMVFNIDFGSLDLH